MSVGVLEDYKLRDLRSIHPLVGGLLAFFLPSKKIVGNPEK
jgi:hypothetical protein